MSIGSSTKVSLQILPVGDDQVIKDTLIMALGNTSEAAHENRLLLLCEKSR